STMAWKSGAKIRVQNNALTFEDLEPNVVFNSDANVAEFNYSPQAVVGTETYTYVDAGSPVMLDAGVGGTANVYTWIKGADEFVGDESTLSIAAFDPATNSGKYTAIVQNTLLPGLDINVAPQNLFASATAQDSLALVALYNTNGGANWTGFDNWLNGPLNTWEQVTMDSLGERVVHVSFKQMDLTGTLTEEIGNLTMMGGKIEFHDDVNLVGELPAAIWKWTNVERFQLKRSGITSIDLTGIENMVNLTEYNTEKNAISGEVPASIFALPAMEKVYLHDCNYDAVPTGILAASGKLDRLYLNGNDLSDLPDLSTMAWKSGAKIRVQNNALTFEDLEPNVVFNSDANVAEFNYSPQAVVGTETYTYVDAGSPVMLDAGVGGTANIYEWIKGVDELVSEESTFSIAAFDPATNSGKYTAIVQNSLVQGLVITVAPQKLFTSVQAQDSLALVALYNTNGGADWTGYDTWLNGPISAWEGVIIDSASQRVVNVNFKDMNLVGTLAQEIEDITQMGGKIELRDDTLMTGELPAFLWKWTNVERFQIKFSGITSIDLTGIENMINLTEYNTEGNAIGGTIPGEIFTLPAMQKVYLHDCEYDAIPAEMTAATGLDRLYVNGNNLTDLPNMSSMVWGAGAKVRVQNNGLTFEDLEDNVVIREDTLVAEFNYSPQNNIGEATIIEAMAGDTVNLSLEVGGSANMYTWIKGEAEVVSEMPMYTIESVTVEDGANYRLLVQSELVPGLDIMSETFQLVVDGVNSTYDLNLFGEINVMGNPMTHTLSIQTDKVIEWVMIHHINGQQVRNRVVNNQQVSLPVSDLTPGLYLVTLHAEGRFHTLKMVKR
ncbi:MAG: T9SS type A sorting domain-containing protein, partial [Bacteroidota bacterium]